LTLALALVFLLWALATSLAIWKSQRFPPGFYRDLLAVGGFGAILAGFFWQLLFLPNIMVPPGGGDLAAYLYPPYRFAASNLQQGLLPLWNPYQYSGSPFAADMQTGMFYPPNLVAFFLVRPFTYMAMEGLAVVHFFLGALFTYIYARGLGVGRIGAFGAGIVFGFGGFVTAHLGHLNMISSAVWLPLILFFFHKAVMGKGTRWAVAAGLAYGVSTLPGHLQITLYLAFFLVLYWLWGMAVHWRKGGRLVPPLALLVALPLSVLVAYGLAAVQLLPSYQLTSLSVRAALSYPEAAEYAGTPLAFITLLVPHFLGADSANYWGIQGNITEVYGYSGLLPLLLAAMALILPKSRTPWKWFFLLAAGLFLLLSIGQETILHGWLYRFGPGFDKVRAPGRFILFFDFAVAVLAGLGLDALCRPLARRERPRFRLFLQALFIATAGGILVVAPFFYNALLTSQDKDPIIFKRVFIATNSLNLTLLFLAAGFVIFLLYRYGARWRAFLPYLALGVVIIDLTSANSGYNPTDQNVLEGFQHPQVVAFLKQDPDLFRIDTATGVWDVWQPGTGLNNQLFDLHGQYFNPMMLADYDRYWGSLGSRSVPSYDLLNAKYVVAHKDVVLDWQKFKPVLTDAPKVNVYQNLRFLPRAMIVPRAEVLPRDQILERLRQPDFDPTQKLFLEQGPARNPANTSFPRQVLGVTYPTPNEVVVRAETQEPAYLFLAEVDYPGWKAYLDGKEVKLLRANYLFRAVDLPAGRHTARFSFEPRLWKMGAGTSAIFLVGAILALAVTSRRR
jgi:hypothetical protein